MRSTKLIICLTLLVLFAGLLRPLLHASAQSSVTAYDLIAAMNTLRMANGLPPLKEDPIINAVAQSTAEIMAANQMSWHIGDVDGRLAAAGYGGGAKVYGTENFAVGMNQSIDEIMVVWSDPSHMIPAVNPAYCHVGAGVAQAANGRTYYVLQAAYIAGKSCGEYKPPSGGNSGNTGGDSGAAAGVPQYIVPVKLATPDAEGRVYHVVEYGQSLWAIAVAYQITIKDLTTWNNISPDSKLQVGQKLFIPGSNTEGYATPTPVGMVATSTPDKDGRIIHVVQAYQTLITIAEAYHTSVDTILAYNGLQVDWPLQIDQKLIIHPGNITPSPTPRPLTPIERLTPEADGKYYHVISSGETLSWIAAYYDISVTDLMAWNGLNSSSIIIPGQKLLLQVTPPATDTVTPGPPTATFTATTPAPTPTATRTPPPPTASVTPDAAQLSVAGGGSPAVWFLSAGLALGGLALVMMFTRRRAS